MAEQHILIIHLSRLGAMIQSLPAVTCLKNDNPDCHISYFGIKEFSDLLQGHPCIDRLLTAPLDFIDGIFNMDDSTSINNLNHLFDTVPELTEKYDVLINLTHSAGSSYLTDKIAAREKRGRVFSEQNEIVVSGNWGKYLFAVARNRRDNTLNLADIYMGMAGVRHRPVENYLITDEACDRSCRNVLSEQGCDPTRPAIGFQLGASKEQLTWPIEKFVKLGEFITEQMGVQIVLVGSPHERHLAEIFHSSAHYNVIDLVGKTNVKELASLLKHLDVLVTNDTRPMHIAAAVGTKAVGIFLGPAHFSITGPYGAGHILMQSHYPCAPCVDSTVCQNPLCRESISPDDVLIGINKILKIKGVYNDRGDSGSSLYLTSFRSNGMMQYELLNSISSRFLPWLTVYHETKSSVSQLLWNQWLGVKSQPITVGDVSDDASVSLIINDFKDACSFYHQSYERGMNSCKIILNEFKKRKPNIHLIQHMIDTIKSTEEEIRNAGSSLNILKDIHELHIAETALCDFPQLAQEFFNKYKILAGIVNSFKSGLQDSLDIRPVEIS